MGKTAETSGVAMMEEGPKDRESKQASGVAQSWVKSSAGWHCQQELQ
jgi:hypothetical protein